MAYYYHCQYTKGIFHRTRTNNLKISMKTEKTSNNQSNLDKKDRAEASCFLTSGYNTKLQ